MPNRSKRTYVEDVKDPDQVLFPSYNLLPITFREDGSDHCVPFTLLYDLPPDPRQSSVIESSVNISLAASITASAHKVRSPIPSRMDWLSPSNRLPFSLRSSTWHTSPQARPRST